MQNIFKNLRNEVLKQLKPISHPMKVIKKPSEPSKKTAPSAQSRLKVSFEAPQASTRMYSYHSGSCFIIITTFFNLINVRYCVPETTAQLDIKEWCLLTKRERERENHAKHK